MDFFKEQLKKILESGHLTSSIDRKLLKYLVDGTIKGKSIKEIDIAIDIFGRDDNFNPMEDSIVRSHMYSLRKKLKSYYLLNEGKEDLELIIPKGHYKVEILNTKPHQHKPENIKLQYLPWALTIVLLVVTVFLIYRNSGLPPISAASYVHQEENAFFSDFYKSDLPTLLVIGDYFVFQEPHNISKRERFIRDVKINSEKDFAEYLEMFPDEKAKTSRTPLTYLGAEAPYVISMLVKCFNPIGDRFNIKLASDLNWQDIQNNNIIFVGSVKTLRQLRHFLDQLRYKVSLFPHKIYYTPNHTDTLDTISLESYYRHGFHNDFPIVAKFPSSNKNIVMIITSFSSFGKIEGVKNLINPEFLKKIIETKGELPNYFEMLLKVHGVEKSGFDTSILHFHEIANKDISTLTVPAE